MDILGQVPIQLMLFFILYGITGVVPLLATVYLLWGRGNVIAPDVTPPVRLRRWAASFFAVVTLAHVWWFLFYICSGDLQSVSYLVLAMLDCVLLFTTFAGTLLAMLQDRRRSVWPALVAVIPFVVLGVAFMVWPSSLLRDITAYYIILLYISFTAYMVVAIRQYGHWLNDNYADLENKKVWLSQTVALVCMLLFILYALAVDMVFIWLVHIIELVLVGLLLWRVETLPLLDDLPEEVLIPEEVLTAPTLETMAQESLNPQPSNLKPQISNLQPQTSALSPQTSALSPQPSNLDLDLESPITKFDIPQIERRLAVYCVETKLYLQHDLTIQQLAVAINTNRSYLSLYYSRQGITYNTYINNLRINHFISRYQELVAAGQPVFAQQLAKESGYRSYSTFSLAFKQRTGQSVSTWMREAQ